MTFTAQLIESKLTDKNMAVHHEWAKRMDWTPTPEQVKRGMSDEEKEESSMGYDIRLRSHPRYSRHGDDRSRRYCKKSLGQEN